jgi:hypothetical protein
MMGLGVNAWVASSAEIALPVQHRACGIQWNYTWSEPARESLLLVGAVPAAFGVGNDEA